LIKMSNLSLFCLFFIFMYIIYVEIIKRKTKTMETKKEEKIYRSDADKKRALAMSWNNRSTWRKKKLKDLLKLSKLEKENIYYNYENGWRDMTLSEFADKERLAPIDMSKFLREYQVATGEDVNNELKSILKADSGIIKDTQSFIREYLETLRKQKKAISIKEIEILLKASDSALKRQTIIDKMMSDKLEKNNANNTPMVIKLSL